MTISSGSSPMAYVLSNYQTNTTSIGQHLFKFDPLTFSTAPVWIKKTLGITYSNLKHLGLVFGRNQSFIYAFSRYNKPTVTLLDTSGNPYWQFSLDSVGDHGTMIQYKQIDNTTDMIIATNGYYNIYFNRIISSSSFPYTVQMTKSQTYKDPTTSPLSYDYRKVKALYITGLDNAVSLIHDSSSQYSDIATINFLTPSISFQRAFPQISHISSAIFTSPTVYYAGSYDDIFFTDQSNNQTIRAPSWYHSIVYSSDMTSTSCYSMAPIMTATPVSMNVTNLTSLPQPIYEPSPVTFINDTLAYSTIDIEQSTLIRVSWCPLYSYTVNTFYQTTSFYLAQGVATDKYFPIKPFNASVNCGNYANSWTYSGYNNTNGNQLVSSTDLIDVNSTTGEIFVSKSIPFGTYKIKVQGTLPDQVTKTSEIFTINVINFPPRFVTYPSNVEVPLKSQKNYKFPNITDQNLGDSFSISEVKDSSTGSLPEFVTFNSTLNSLDINPTLMTQVKQYNMTVNITDTKATGQYKFQITVTNKPPVFTKSLPSSIVVNIGSPLSYILPASMDPEGLPYTTTMTSGPSFVSLISNSSILFINPSSCESDFGNQTVQIKLEDEQPLRTNYSIVIEVRNLPPVYKSGTQLENQQVMINQVAYQSIESFQDPEGCPITITIEPLMLQQFVKIQGKQIIYSPTQQFQLGSHNIKIICTDNLGASFNLTSTLIVYQFPKFTGSIIKQIDLLANNIANYTLPIKQDKRDEYVIHYPSLPSFVTFESPVYYFNPDKASFLGIQTIYGQLFNSFTSIDFQFKLNITNYPPYLSDKIQDQIISLETQLSYLIPEAVDREGQTIYYSAHEVDQSILPAFVKFNIETKEFIFKPTKLDVVKVYSIQLDLTDSFAAISSTTFTVTLYDSSKFIKPIQEEKQNSSSSTQKNLTLDFFNLMKKENKIQSFILGIEIIKVSRDQKAIIKITNSNNTQISISAEIVFKLTNSSLEIIVQQKNTSYQIGFEIISRDLTNQIIQLNLKYPNPSNLSLDQISDKIKITTIDRIQTQKNQIQAILPENIQSEAHIPPQVTKFIQYKVINSIQGGRIVFTENTPLNLGIGFIIQIWWINIQDISFLAINSMIAIAIPGIPSIIQAVMIKYIYFDLFYTELWIEQLMRGIGIPFDSLENDSALNLQFAENGYDSKQFLKNSGSSIFLLFIFIFLWGLLLLFSLLSRCSDKMSAVKSFLMKQLMWRLSLNFLLSQYPPLFLCSLLNMHDTRFFDKENLGKISSIISFFVIIAVIVVLIIIFKKIFKLTRNLNQEQVIVFNTNYSVLTESLRETDREKLIFFWKPLYLLRWTLTVIILIVAKDIASFQIVILLIISVIYQSLILFSKPFETQALNLISFYNEVAVSAYLYLAFLVSDFLETQVPDDQQALANLRLMFAWIMTGILIFTILINFIFSFVDIARSVFKYLKTKFGSKKQSEEKYLKQQQPNNEKHAQYSKNAKSIDQTRLEQDNQEFQENNIQQMPTKINSQKYAKLPFEFNKAKIHDIFAQQPQSIVLEPSIQSQVHHQIFDASGNADFSKLGYRSYQYYPGAYSIPKIIEETKNEKADQQNDSVFNFFQKI